MNEESAASRSTDSSRRAADAPDDEVTSVELDEDGEAHAGIYERAVESEDSTGQSLDENKVESESTGHVVENCEAEDSSHILSLHAEREVQSASNSDIDEWNDNCTSEDEIGDGESAVNGENGVDEEHRSSKRRDRDARGRLSAVTRSVRGIKSVKGAKRAKGVNRTDSGRRSSESSSAGEDDDLAE